MTSTTSPDMGWYTDPSTPTQLRYWDGTAWTADTTPVPAPQAAPQPYGVADVYGAQPYGAPQPHGGHAVPPGYVVVPYAARPSAGSSPSDPLHWLLPTGRSGFSIAAGYVALFALVVWVLGPVALVLGILGLRHSARTGLHGRGRAWFGIVVGVLASVVGVWALVAWQ